MSDPSKTISVLRGAKKKTLKKSAKRTESSRRWLLRQINDPYVQAAQDKGYRSRAAFKLLEIQNKFHLFKPGLTIVDLGAAPGGWTQVIVECTASSSVISIDLLPMDPVAGAHVIQDDFMNIEQHLQHMGVQGIDVLLSDLSPPTCGLPKVDYLRIMGFVETVFEIAENHLNPGGAMVIKVLRGGTEQTILQKIKKRFEKVTHFKPGASRQESREIYLVALGFR